MTDYDIEFSDVQIYQINFRHIFKNDKKIGVAIEKLGHISQLKIISPNHYI